MKTKLLLFTMPLMALLSFSSCGTRSSKEFNTNGYGYVDLGLPSGNLWATMNVGSTTVEGEGDEYSWGETENNNYRTYKEREENYKFLIKPGTLVNGFSYPDKGYSKYVPKHRRNYGYGDFYDEKTTLDLEDDVAHVKMGGSWRMPTYEDFMELIQNCESVWCTYQGIKGFKFTAKNGEWLFLPKSGYWTSSLVSDDPEYSNYISTEKFDVTGRIIPQREVRHRYYPGYVRAVCPTK